MVVGIALLGAGFVSNFYMSGLQAVPEMKVRMVYSRTEAGAKSFAEKWRIPEWTTDMVKAVQRRDIDLVIIGLPNFLHKDATILAVEARKNVVCTKPLGRDVDEARDMLNAVKRAGVLHGYAETEVFCPAVVKAKDVIDRGGIGEVFWIRSREAHFGPHSAWFWNPKLSGGGALMDMGCHTVEAARYLFGKKNRALEAVAWGDTIVHKTEAEDNAILLVRFEGKKISQSEISWSSRGGLDLRNEIYGTKGTMFTDVTRSTPITVFTATSAGYVVEKAEIDKGWVFPVVEEPWAYGYYGEMRHFVDCVQRGEMPRETYEDGYTVNAIIDAGYRSMKTDRWEKVSE